MHGPQCHHCKLDDSFVDWEVRLFSLRTNTGGQVGSVAAMCVEGTEGAGHEAKPNTGSCGWV